MATPVLLPHNILVSGGSAPRAAAIYNYMLVIFYTLPTSKNFEEETYLVAYFLA